MLQVTNFKEMRHEKPTRILVHVTGLFPLELGYNYFANIFAAK